LDCSESRSIAGGKGYGIYPRLISPTELLFRPRNNSEMNTPRPILVPLKRVRPPLK